MRRLVCFLLYLTGVALGCEKRRAFATTVATACRSFLGTFIYVGRESRFVFAALGSSGLGVRSALLFSLRGAYALQYVSGDYLSDALLSFFYGKVGFVDGPTLSWLVPSLVAFCFESCFLHSGCEAGVPT